MSGLESGAELYRVRHTRTGAYLAWDIRHSRRAELLVDGVSLFLDRQAKAVQGERALAEKIANLWIALTGDHSIEIEPVEG